MTLPEETPKSEEPADRGEDTFAAAPELPEGFTPIGDLSSLPRARRRRAQRSLSLPGADERAALLADLAHRASPSVEFFLFSVLCGVTLGAAYLLDAPALLLLAVLFAPLMTPWVGLTLAVVTGSWRFFLQTLGGLLVGSLLVFFTGALAGAVGRFWKADLHFFHADIHAHLWWPDLLVTALGAVFLAISFVRSEQKPLVPSIMLAYGFFLPLGAAGIGLGIGEARLWPGGVAVFLVHLAFSLLLGALTLVILRFKPARAAGYLLPLAVLLAALLPLVLFTGLAAALRDGITAAGHRLPSPTPTPTLTAAPSQTSTPITYLEPSETPTLTATVEPVALFALVAAPSGDGAYLRAEPGSSGAVVTTILNGFLLELLNETQIVDGVTWVHVRMANGVDGWILQTNIAEATLTPTVTERPLTATPTP